MNVPARPIPRLDDYPYHVTDNVRFGDMDVNHHVNNAVYATYFEGGRVELTKNPVYGITPDGASWVLGHLAIRFRAELHWPATIELALGVARVGRTSVTFDQAVFSKGVCIATAESTIVMVDRESRRPAPIPQGVIDNLQRWKMRGDGGAG